MQEIEIVPFSEKYIMDKVNWYNNEAITKFLHYEEKFTYEGTYAWLEKIKEDNTRYENVIEINEDNNKIPIGIIGLFNIDLKNKKAGFYITIGNVQYQGKGYAYKATIKFLEDCFKKYDLEKIYLYTDYENEKAIKLYERVGFKREGLLRKELYYKGRYIDRYYYGLLKCELKGGN